MNKRSHQSVYSDHDEVLLLLPWFANGTLMSDDLEKVKNHLKVCLTCRRELAGFESLSASLLRQPSLEISYKPSFERLMVRIQQQEKVNLVAKRPARKNLLTRFGEWFSTWSAPTYLVPALATVTIAAFIPFLMRDDGLSSDTAQTFHTLAMPGSMANYVGSDIQVVFSDDVSKQEITNLISAIQADILDGPSDRGIYTVRIRADRDLQGSLARLRQNNRVVFAEPVLGPSFSPEK